MRHASRSALAQRMVVERMSRDAHHAFGRGGGKVGIRRCQLFSRSLFRGLSAISRGVWFQGRQSSSALPLGGARGGCLRGWCCVWVADGGQHQSHALRRACHALIKCIEQKPVWRPCFVRGNGGTSLVTGLVQSTSPQINARNGKHLMIRAINLLRIQGLCPCIMFIGAAGDVGAMH